MRRHKLILAAAALCAISAADAAGQTTTNNTGLVLEIMARRSGVTAGDFDATQFQMDGNFAPTDALPGLASGLLGAGADESAVFTTNFALETRASWNIGAY